MTTVVTKMAHLVTRVRKPARMKDAGKTAGDSQNWPRRNQNVLPESSCIWNICSFCVCVCLNNCLYVLFGLCTDWQDAKHVRNNIRWARLKPFKGVYCSPRGRERERERERRWLITTAISLPQSLISHFLITDKHYQPRRVNPTSSTASASTVAASYCTDLKLEQ